LDVCLGGRRRGLLFLSIRFQVKERMEQREKEATEIEIKDETE